MYINKLILTPLYNDFKKIVIQNPEQSQVGTLIKDQLKLKKVFFPNTTRMDNRIKRKSFNRLPEHLKSILNFNSYKCE